MEGHSYTNKIARGRHKVTERLLNESTIDGFMGRVRRRLGEDNRSSRFQTGRQEGQRSSMTFEKKAELPSDSKSGEKAVCTAW